MSNWPMRPLGELCSIASGGTPSRSIAAYFDGDIPWVKIGDMLQGTITNTDETISAMGLTESSAKMLPAGTVLISIFATIGRTAVLGIPAATNQAIAGLTPLDPSKLIPTFLRHYLDFSVATLSGQARGMAQLNINLKILRSLEVPVPPLAEQERIVRLLDEADAIRKLRAQADQRTADLIPALFHDMFGDPVTNSMGWTVKPLGEIARLVSGGTPSRTNDAYWYGTIPWVSPKDMKSVEITDSQEHITDEGLRRTTLKLIPESTVLIVVRGMILAHTVPVAITRVPVTINQDMKAILPIQPINSSFLAWSLLAQHYKLLSIVSTAGHGTKRLDSDALASILTPVPPESLQSEFAEQASFIQSQMTMQLLAQGIIEDASVVVLQSAF